MENFELQLKKFCQLTIQLIDLKQESYAFIDQQNYEGAANILPKKKIISEQLLSIIKAIEIENSETIITANNVNDAKIITSFLNQFQSSNPKFHISVDNRIQQIQLEIDDKLKNQEFKNIDNLKLEIIKLEKSKSENSNWWMC